MWAHCKKKIESEKRCVYSFCSIFETYVRALPVGEGSKVDLQTYMGSWENFELICLV